MGRRGKEEGSELSGAVHVRSLSCAKSSHGARIGGRKEEKEEKSEGGGEGSGAPRPFHAPAEIGGKEKLFLMDLGEVEKWRKRIEGRGGKPGGGKMKRKEK